MNVDTAKGNRMFLNEEIIKNLREECGMSEKGISSHWTEMLSGFEEKGGKFFAKGLPEGEGGSGNLIKEFIHWLLQAPFRCQGHRFGEFGNILGTAKKIHRLRGNRMRLGTLRQAISLAFLEEKIKISRIKDPVIVIGDGFGLMSSLILRDFPHLKVVAVNLTKNLLIDAVFIMKSVPGVQAVLVKNADEFRSTLDNSETRCVLVQAGNAKALDQSNMGLVINICSMQEMNPETIKEYFCLIRSSRNEKTFFYCANRREKKLPDGTVGNFFEYPWHPQDRILIDELCPWQQKFYAPKPPFYFPYEGPVQHRLALMHKSAQ